MQRLVPAALVLIALFLGLGSASIATAQGGPAELGAPTTIVDPEGIIRGTVTVTKLEDPFLGYETSAPPPDGMRYVLLNVTFEAAADQPLDAQPYQIVLADSDGFLRTTQYVYRPADAAALMPDFQAQPMSPGDRTSGAISYVVPVDAEIDRVAYQPAYDRLIDLADLLPGAGPALGDAVTYTDAKGGSATVTTELIDQFSEHDPNYPPEAGMRFVMLRPVFENVGQIPYWADPHDLALRDAEGYVYAPGSIYRPADVTVAMLESQTTNPGDRVSGYVGYVVPADAQLTDILYYPEAARMALLADLDGGAPVSPSVTAEPSAPPPAGSSSAPVASPETPAPDASAGTGR